MIKRTIIFVLLCSGIWAGAEYVDSHLRPDTATRLALAAVNGGNREAVSLRESTRAMNWIDLLSASLTLIAAVGCFGVYGKRGIGLPGK